MRVTEVMTVGIGSPPGMMLPMLSKTSMEHIVNAMPLFFLTVLSSQLWDKSKDMEKERGEQEQRFGRSSDCDCDDDDDDDDDVDDDVDDVVCCCCC